MKFQIAVLIFIIFIALVITAIILLVSKNKLKPTQQSKQQSLKQGLGFYSDPTFTRCQNSDGKSDCNRPSTQKVIYNCIPHPVTQKGCIDQNGDLSYNPKVVEKACNLPCVQSKLIQEDKIQLKLVNSVGVCSQTGQITQEPRYQSVGSGCNRIVNKFTGLEYTDYFLGKYNPTNGEYKLDTCIPSEEYVGYSITKTTCTPNEGIDGINNCQVSCGEKNTLNYNGIFGSKLSTNVLQYYPVEYDEDGVRRNVCYNLFGTNQVEILNNNKFVPSNFYFPTKCYGIYNTQSNISFNNYYPIGNESSYQTESFFSNSTKYFLLNNENKDIDKIIDTNNFESIYQNYENYTFVKIGNETTLLGNLYKNSTSQSVNTSINNIGNYFGNGYFQHPNSNTITFAGASGSVNFNSAIAFDNQNFYLAEPFNNIFENISTQLYTYYIENNKTYITGNFSSLSNVYGLYYITEENYQNNNNGKVVEIESSTSTTIVLNHQVSETNSHGKIYIFLARKVLNSTNPSGMGTSSFYNNFHITGNLRLNRLSGNKIFNTVLINSGNSLQEGTCYYYYGKKSSTGSNLFYYPLYTNPGSNLHQISFRTLPNKIFYTSDTEGHSLGPSTLGSKNLNIENGTVDIVLKYPTSQTGISFFPIGFDVVSPGIKYGKSSGEYYDSNFGSISVKLQPENLNNYYFVCLLRNNSDYIPQTRPLNYANTQEEKLYTYFDAIKNVENLNNTIREEIDIVFLPEKNYILEADYDVFLSPYTIEENGQINRLCYDDNNRPLQRGIIKTLKTKSEIYHNYGCNNYKLEDGVSAFCGKYVTENNLPCFQTFQDNNPTYGASCAGVNIKSTYFNNQGFLEEGVYDDKQLKCNSKNCFPLKYTTEASNSVTNYEKNDEVYLNKQKKDYYLSLVNNNNFDPLNAEYWSRIFPYNPGESVTVGQRFFIKPQDQDTIYVYECTEDGVAPYGLEDLSINFDYLKQQPVYTTFANTGLEISSYGAGNPEGFFSSLTGIVTSLDKDETFYSYVLASQFPFINTYQKILNTIKDVNFTVYSQSLNNITVDVEVKNSGGQAGDVYNPTFSFWSLFINFIYSAVGTTTSVPTEKFILGSIANNSNSGVSFTSFGRNKISQGDYIALIPSEENVGGNKGIEAINLITNYINVKSSGITTSLPNNKFLGEFEVANVLEVSGNNLKLKRNVLNTSSENLFTNTDQALTNIYKNLNLFYIPPEFITLQYQFTSKDKFRINSTVNSNLGISPGSFSTSSGGTCFVISSSEKVGVGFTFQNFYNSKIISNNIVYPSVNTLNGIYYVTNNNYPSQLYNTVTEIYYENNSYYFNEYKVNIEDNSAFNTNDVLNIKINEVNYKFRIVQLNSYANNKFYDYQCVSISSVTNFKTDFLNKYKYKVNIHVSTGSYNLFVPSVISKKSNGNDTYFVYDTGSNNDNKLYLIDDTDTKIGPSISLHSDFDNLGMEPYKNFRKFSGTSPGNYPNGNWVANNTNIGFGTSNASNISFLPTEGPSVASNNSGFDYFCSYQYDLDNGSLATFTLEETTFYGTRDNIGITITQGKGKPAGPSYLKKLPDSNQLLKDGYGHITGFELSSNYVNQKPQSSYYQSDGGFVLFNNSDYKPAKFDIFSVRDNFKEFPVYDLDTYIEGNIVEYTNNNERIYYRNTEGINTFDSRKWKQIPETVFPENNTVFELKDSSFYFPGETINVNNINYNVTKATKGSDFPTNFSIVQKTGNLSSPLNQFYVVKESSRQLSIEDIKTFNTTNTDKYPLALINTSTNNNFCPSQCTGTCVINYDSNSFVEKVYSNIGASFYNNTYIYSQQNISEDFWSLSNTPVAKGSNDYDVKFLQQTNDPFNGDLFSQYIFSLAAPENIQNSSIACSGSCFSNIDNKIYANSLLNFTVPVDLDSQDMIKYNINTFESNEYITPFVQDLRIPSCRTSFSAVVYDGSSYQNKNVDYGTNINYIENYITLPPDNYTFTMENSSTKKIILDVKITDFDYLPFAKIASHGSCFQFGDLWYIGTSSKVISHGYLDPMPGGSLHQRSFIYIQKHNSASEIDGNSYGLCYVTEEGHGFELQDGLDFTDKYVVNYSSSSANSTVTSPTGNYTLKTIKIKNGKNITVPSPAFSANLVSPELIDQSNYHNQNFAIVPATSFTATDQIYQKTDKQDYIKTRLYSMFGKNYLSSLVYGPNNDVFNNQGNQLPGLVFKPYKGQIFGTQEPDFELLAGNKVQAFKSYQDVFLLSTNQNNELNIRTNPYTYPLNDTTNYDFVINGLNSPNIFNMQNITNQEYSSLNVIETTDPSLLIGTSTSGICFVNSGTLTNLFDNTIMTTNNTTKELSKFVQIRENESGLHYDSSLNCTLFFTQPKSITDFSITDQIIFETDTSISPSGPVNQQFNYGININQNKVKSSSNAGYFTTESDVTITNAGTSPFMLGNKKLYIYYYLSYYSVSHEVYQNKKYFESQSNKNIVLVCQSDLQTSSGTCTINFKYGSNSIPITFRE